MRKELIYLVFIATIFISCEEYYEPKIEVVPAIMVVESHLTNDSSQNFVRISLSQDFYSTTPKESIKGAKVDIVALGNKDISGIENSSGYFTFAEAPVPGRQYLLRISYEKEIFESEYVLMPPIPSIDSLYTKHAIKKIYRTDTYGSPTLLEVPGRNICIDAQINSQIGFYRFSSRAILQWVYNPPATMGPPPPPWFGWLSIYDRGLFNLAGSKEFSVSNKVRQHPVVSLDYESQNYLDYSEQIARGWILIVDQYGITQESYNFHKQLNQQFSAEGSLFDPVLTQVYGNIKCKTSPGKVVLGFFDLNSYRQYRYYLNLGTGPDSQVIQRQLYNYPDIPGEGLEIGNRPAFWESN